MRVAQWRLESCQRPAYYGRPAEFLLRGVRGGRAQREDGGWKGPPLRRLAAPWESKAPGCDDFGMRRRVAPKRRPREGDDDRAALSIEWNCRPETTSASGAESSDADNEKVMLIEDTR